MRINQMIANSQSLMINSFTNSTNSVRKFMEIRLENLYGDIGGSRVKLKNTINFGYLYEQGKMYHTLFGRKR